MIRKPWLKCFKFIIILLIIAPQISEAKQSKTSKLGIPVLECKIEGEDIDLKKGLVAEWKLAGDAKDSLGQSNGLPKEVVFKQEGSFHFGVFNGKTSVIIIKPRKSLLTSKGITVSAWIKRIGNSDSKSASVIVGRSGYHDGWRLMVTDDQRKKDSAKNLVRFQIGALKRSMILSSETKLEIGKWTYITAVWDGTRVKVCINAKGSWRYYSGKYIPTKYWLGIGYNSRGVGHFNGNIGDVRIWNRALTDSEIQAVYKQGLTKLAGGE